MKTEVLSEKAKVCAKCRKRKPITDFPKKRNRCKSCAAKYNRGWRNNKDIAPKTTGYRICTKCNKCKKITKFPPDLGCKDGRKRRCSSCIEKDRHYINKKISSINKLDTQHKLSSEILRSQLAQQDSRCHYCRVPLTTFSVDHKTPISRGGTNLANNIALTCIDCNHLKFCRTEKEFKIFLDEYVERVNSNRRLTVKS